MAKQTVRTSVSFPKDIFEALDEIAQEKKVSVSWVVREAAADYLKAKWPLFGLQMRG